MSKRGYVAYFQIAIVEKSNDIGILEIVKAQFAPIYRLSMVMSVESPNIFKQIGFDQAVHYLAD